MQFAMVGAAIAFAMRWLLETKRSFPFDKELGKIAKTTQESSTRMMGNSATMKGTMMMYKNVKLEKGLYHITGKRFSDMLEHMDPSEAYKDTALAGLDAYERQLKRFDIHVCGPHCDRVEKFFSTTESAVLFPEFIRRAVYRGIEQSVLSEIVAVQTIAESSEYLGGTFSDGTAYSTTTEQGNELPTATFYETNSAMKLKKYGRVIHASYEAVRRQRLDAFGAYLRSVGVRLSNALLQEATTAMFDQAGAIIAPGSSTLS